MLHCLKESYPFKWQYLISRHCEWGLDRLVFPDSALKSVDVSFHIPSPPPLCEEIHTLLSGSLAFSHFVCESNESSFETNHIFVSIESNFSSPNFCHKLWISVTDGAIVPGSDITAAITTHSVRCPYRSVCVRGVRKWVIERARWPKHKRDYIPTVSPLTRDLHLGTLIAEFLSIQYRGEGLDQVCIFK